MIDGLKRLWHYAVISGNDQHHNVGRLGAPRAHAREGFMTGRVEKHNLAPVGGRFRIHDLHLVSADMLRDSAGFALGHSGRTYRIEQGGLAVIHVPHDRDHRGTWYGFGATLFASRGRVGYIFLRLLFEADDVRVGSEEARHLARQLCIERLIDRGKYASRQQTGNQILRANIQLLRQILHADAFRDGDVPRDRLRLIRKRKPRRRNIALHRAFLHTARNIALSGPARWTTGTASRARWSRRS